jgi:hypothetical protein
MRHSLAPILLRLQALGVAMLMGLHGVDVRAVESVNVQVQQRGQLVIVDVEASVPAPPAQVWSVITDFDHMANFMSALKTSWTVARHGDMLEVEQSGEARRGLLHFSFHTVREISIGPGYELKARMLKGAFTSYELTQRVVDQGGTTLIRQHGEYEPDTWVPPIIGPSAIKAETIKGFNEIITEIVRRRDAVTTP